MIEFVCVYQWDQKCKGKQRVTGRADERMGGAANKATTVSEAKGGLVVVCGVWCVVCGAVHWGLAEQVWSGTSCPVWRVPQVPQGWAW